MGRTLVTGAGGLVGSHVARALVARGDDVRLLLREDDDAGAVADLDVERIVGDPLDRRTLQRALRGVDRFFHIPGPTPLRARWRVLYRVNIDGTRVALEEALRAGVERVVHTSSVSAIGPAPRGSTADEGQPFTAGRYGLSHLTVRHAAEQEVLRLCARGLPAVIVNPAHVLGAGDAAGSSTELVRRFLRRQIPLYVDGAICIVGARDVARGHLLAEERGRPGERYILGGRNFTNDRLFADLGRLSGVEPPALKLPLSVALALARAAEAAPGRPVVTAEEVRAMSLWWAFRSTKAKRELGWAPGHHEQPLLETIEWFRERDGDGVGRPGDRQPLPLRVAGFGLRRTFGAARFVTGR